MQSMLRIPPKRLGPASHAFSTEQLAELKGRYFDAMLDYQRKWYEAGQQHHTRNLITSRQIGTTYHFAGEALLDALETGRNQTFLAPTKAQALLSRRFIERMARQVGVTLQGDIIHLANGASILFVGAGNSPRAPLPGYNGSWYIDSYCWMHGFNNLNKVAIGWSAHKTSRMTYFSAASHQQHDGYAHWSGAPYNLHRPKSEQINLDISHRSLAKGRLCEDGQWRQIVTAADAINGGCDWINLDKLKRACSAEEFANLFMCEFYRQPTPATSILTPN